MIREEDENENVDEDEGEKNQLELKIIQLNNACIPEIDCD